MTLQEYLGTEYIVTQITHEDGYVSFNVKREGFEYDSLKYHLKQLPSIINILGNTVITKYASWKFLQEMK